MARLLFSIMFLMMSASYTGAGTGETYVYICTGPQSTKYHKTNTCRGLDRCSKEVVKVTLDKAKDMKRTPCGYCYKKKK